MFVEADSKEDLVRAFVQINIQTKRENRFFDIQKDGRKWIAWYYIKVKP